MKYNLKSLSRKELEKLQSDVSKALEKVGQREMKAAKIAAEKAAAAHGFSLSDLTGGAAPAKAKKAAKSNKKPAPAKFRNPADSKQTWSGKGRQPDWFKTAVAAGKKPASMAI